MLHSGLLFGFESFFASELRTWQRFPLVLENLSLKKLTKLLIARSNFLIRNSDLAICLKHLSCLKSGQLTERRVLELGLRNFCSKIS